MGLHLGLAKFPEQDFSRTQQRVDTHTGERLAKRPKQGLEHLSTGFHLGIGSTTVRFDAADSRNNPLFEQLCLLLHMVLHRSNVHRVEQRLVGFFHFLKKLVQILIRTFAFEVAVDLAETGVELIGVQSHIQSVL